MIDSKYYSSKYYDKYGDIFKELEFLAPKMGKEWDAYIKMYDEMDIILHKYLSLRNMHGTDLKLYALMYRNVDIGSCSIVDKSFFLSRANEISGYRNIIYSNNASYREKLVRYYFEYEFLFEMFFRNTIGADILPLPQNENITLESYQIIKDKKFGRIPGINDLSDQTCSVLLSNLNKLESSINDDKYFVNSIKRYDNFVDFIKQVAFPYYFGPHRVHEECFPKYSKDYCNNATFEIIQSKYYDHLCQLYSQITPGKHSWDYTDSEIEALKREKRNLGASSTKLYSLKNGVSSSYVGHISIPSYLIFNPIFEGESDEERNARIEYQRKREEQRKLELERALREEEREREKKIVKLEKEVELDQLRINNINRKISQIQLQKWDEIEKEFEELVNDLSKTWFEDSLNVWKHMFEHQDYLQNHISTFYKTRYVDLKKNQTTDTYLERMKSVRGRSITDFVTLMSDPLRKERAEKGFKRGLDLSAHENVCINQRAARQWANEIKKIINEKEEKERIIREEEERKRREAEEKRLERYRFNMRNKHWRDDNISLRKADHLYIVDGTPLDSITTFVKNCFPEFDSDSHAKRKAEALGITKEEVLEMWDKKGRESREQGTAMHEKIESYYLGKSVSTDETFELFKIFANKITLKPYRTEWAVYDWDQKIAGTIDFVDYQNGEYIIYDWKRSDKLIAKNGLPIKNSQYGVKALPPIENLDDSPYYHYALQLSLYKYILEKNYGITVSKLRLGIFHPSYNKPYVLEMPYLQNEIDSLFGLRSEVIF